MKFLSKSERLSLSPSFPLKAFGSSDGSEAFSGSTGVLPQAVVAEPLTPIPAEPVSSPELPDPEAVAAQPEPHQSEPPTKPSSRRRLIIIGAVVGVGAIIGGIAGYHWWQYASVHEQTDNATIVGHIHNISPRVAGTVSSVLVKDNQTVQRGQTLFILDPRDYQVKVQQAQAALLAAQKQAAVAQANIAVTSQNAQGQTTQAQGDISGAIASIATAQAALSEAQAGVPVAQAAVKSAEAGVQTARAQVTQTDANLGKLQADYERYGSLYRAGAVSRQQYDSAKAAYDVAQAQRQSSSQGVRQAQAALAQAQQGVASAQAKVAQARQGIVSAQASLSKSQGGLQQAKSTALQTNVTKNQFAASEAAITQAQASLKDAQLQLSYTDVVSPTAGTVGRKSVEVGQRVQSGTLTMAIVDPDVWVNANFKETQLERMRPGETVAVTLDAFPHHEFLGRVDSISPASGSQFTLLPPDNATGNFTKIVQRVPVKIVLDRQGIQGYESRLSPGMSAEVNVAVH